MTDLRARLVGALVDSNAFWGFHPLRRKAMALKVTDVLLSLPGIAIVDTNADIEYVAERMADADDGIIYGLLTPDEAEFYKRMARAALLAAANTAEQQKGGLHETTTYPQD